MSSTVVQSHTVLETETAIAPLHTFPDPDVYIWRHEQGTLIEMKNEEEVLKRCNEKRTPFKAWPIAPIPSLTTSFTKSWVFLVIVPKTSDDLVFPALTDHFTVDVEKRIETAEGKFSLVHLHATRIPNPYEDVETLPNQAVSKCAAFKVDVPRSWKTEEGSHVELDLMESIQTASALDDFSSLTLDEAAHQSITLTWDTSSNTFEAELAALHRFTQESRYQDRQVSHKAKLAFRMIMDFGNSYQMTENLHNVFPHLKDPAYPGHRIPKVIVKRFKSFNADHRAAFEGLSKIPNGLYFVNGCPGAGKTEWNMVVSALIQSRSRPGFKNRRSPILFVVDLNKTVDDAADRYYNLCKTAGLRLRIVRMHGWPYEMRHSSKLNGSAPAQDEDTSTELDFTKKFLTTASISKHTNVERNPNKAPTLDEEAWEYYEKHKHDCFTTIKKALANMDAGQVLSSADWKSLRSQVAMLYRAVLAQTDFIATTPVAAYGSFAKLFRPEVVFIDEAPHARELTTLIPIAFFDPIAWILTGDVNQTRPFVKSGDRRDAVKKGLQFNPHAEQLRLSLMARADMAGAINSRLLVNKRAHGNLHRLPSHLFYKDEMTSGYRGIAKYPASVRYLKGYLERLGQAQNMDENRIVIALNQSREQTQRRSFWNPAHHNWIIEQVQKLLQDPEFRSVTDASVPGTIMIQTPYRTAVHQYLVETKQWPTDWQDRVAVVTVDKAQGNQADVVFLDMVRTTKAGFMNEPQRLNVAITRARQAEIILMHSHMNFRSSRGRLVRAEYTSKIWDDAVKNGRLFRI
ncbi:hypothetical protein NM208_g13870 [Fusarium decemcellulare]|uniref:Uncharacterized protein n=1 Tax=Fusarium decemcellulare TaxID=57161 RepID=A0ACC1RI57_9HYPO|nr:hypothetical protein NM208_g13870 [Fusarium decemcellulare]